MRVDAPTHFDVFNCESLLFSIETFEWPRRDDWFCVDENVKSSIQKQAKLINSEPLDISQEGVHFEKGRNLSQFVF